MLKKLIKGLHKFQTQVFPIKKDFFEDLVKGQNPEALFITCSDARINPNLFMSADLGEIFILRNTGNIIPPYEQGNSEGATIEFAISKLGIKDIIICGHSHCGAIAAANQLDTLTSTPSLHSWIKKNIEPTVELVKVNYQNLDQSVFLNILTQEHVLRQIENIKSYPIVNQAILNKELTLHAWIYKFEMGKIYSFDASEGQFNLMGF